MAEDAIMVDQVMDIDSNESLELPTTNGDLVATTNGASATTNTNQNPLNARRNISNPKDPRSNHRDTHKAHPSGRIQKSYYSSTPKTASHKAYNISAAERIKTLQRGLRRQQVTNAIADGSFSIFIEVDGHGLVSRGSSGQATSNPHEVDEDGDDEQEHIKVEVLQLRRLNAGLVKAALFEPIPGMTFDATAPCAFTNGGGGALMADLVQALEAFQVHLARKDRVVLSNRAGGLLRGLARDVLCTAAMQPARPGRNLRGGVAWHLADGEDVFWACVAESYVHRKKVKWVSGRVMSAYARGRLRGVLTSSPPDREYIQRVMWALDNPGSNAKILLEVCLSWLVSTFLVFFFFLKTHQPPCVAASRPRDQRHAAFHRGQASHDAGSHRPLRGGSGAIPGQPQAHCPRPGHHLLEHLCLSPKYGCGGRLRDAVTVRRLFIL